MPAYKVKRVRDESPFSRLWIKNYSLIILGSALMALGYVFFIVPHQLVPGGIFGLSIVLNYLSGFPIGVIAIAVNIPLLLIGFRVLGASFGIKTLVSLVLGSVFIDTLMYFVPEPLVTSDVLVSALFGGAIIGAGIATVIASGATTGGTDVIAKLLNKRYGVSIGRTLILVDGLILSFAVLVFDDLELATYSVIAIIAISRVIDVVLSGLNTKKVLLIISDRHEAIRSSILEHDCGGSLIRGSGLFFPERRKEIILTALDRKDVLQTVRRARVIDPELFMIVMNASDVIGRGFSQG